MSTQKSPLSRRISGSNRLMKPRNLVILGLVLLLATTIQLYRHVILKQFKTFGAILPGHIENPDIGRNIYELIESRGFKYEKHFVQNSRGYILQVARIVNPHVSTQERSLLRPVLLHHGFECSGTLFLIANDGKLRDDGVYVEYDSQGRQINKTTNTLGFTLAVNGHDVWIANYRGSTYSSNHTELSTDQNEFWNFNIDDLIEQDYPAIVEHILKTTKRKTLGYIGHSLGNIIMFQTLASRPEYSQVIKPFIALSPVYYMNGLKTPLVYLAYFKNILRRFPMAFFHMDGLRNAYSTICSNRYLQRTCLSIFSFIIGIKEENIDLDRIAVYMDNLPMGAGSVLAAHLGQFIDYAPTYFDYGDPETNKQHYGTVEVPKYDLSTINSTDIGIIYTSDDWFNTLNNVDLLKLNLKVPLMGDIETPNPTWNHLDLLWSTDTGSKVNKHVLNWLAKYRDLN